MGTDKQDFTKTSRDRAKELIRAGKAEEAIEEVDRIWEEARPIHDLYGDMTAVLLDYVKDKLGEPAVEEAWRFVGERVWRPILEGFRDKSAALLAETYAMFLRSHGYDFTCAEDGEKYVFRLQYCPSGGRMLEEGKAANSERHTLALGVTEEARAWSFDQKDVLYYCAHTKLWFEEQPKEWGIDVFKAEYGDFDDQGRVVGKPCSVTIFKSPRTTGSNDVDPE